jgi:hypothetical protein
MIRVLHFFQVLVILIALSLPCKVAVSSEGDPKIADNLEKAKIHYEIAEKFYRLGDFGAFWQE